MWTLYVVAYSGGLVAGFMGPFASYETCMTQAARAQMTQSYLGHTMQMRCEVRTALPEIQVLVHAN